jgi:hypothetical protein
MQEAVLQEPKQKVNFALAILYWPVIVGLGLYLYYNPEVYVQDVYKSWSLAHILLHSFPLYMFLIRRNRQQVFPFLEILAVFNVIHFGLPVFFIELDDFQLGSLNVEGLSASFIFYALFYSTFYLLRFSKIKVKGVEFAADPSNIKGVKYFGYAMILSYLLGGYIEAIYQLGYVGYYTYIGLFLFLWNKKHLNTTEKVVFIVFILYEFLKRSLDGLVAPLALLILFISLTVLMFKNSKLIIVALLILFAWFYSIFSVIKFDYRNQVWYGEGVSIVEKIELISMLYEESKLNNATPLVNEYKGRQHFLWRFSYQLSALSLVTEMTPETVPYWEGESYVPLLSKFIPRFMWPDKPLENMGYNFGITYNIINRWNTKTSMNTPILAEFYMNFGYAGLYLGAIAMGLLYFLLHSWFNSLTVSYPSRVIGMSIIFPLMIWESNFSLVFGNLILIVFVFYLLYQGINRFFK